MNLAASALLCVAALGPGPHGADPLAFERARATVIRAAVDAVDPALVTIETIGGAQPVRARPGGVAPERFRLGDGPTTGLILTSDGLIITSNINFYRDPTVITVTLSDGRRFVARLLGRDLIRRLALLKIDAQDLPTAVWTSHGDCRVGQYAVAIGRGLDAADPHVSLGIVSACHRRNGNAVQTDAKTSPINYGGPLVDIEGRVIGIIVPMAGAGSALAGTQWYDSGIGFAIHRQKIDFVFDRLAAGETIEPGKIGVILQNDDESLLPMLDDLLPVARGVRIAAIAKVSPAARAGLEVGDKIIALDGQPVADVPDVQRRLSDRAAGETVKLTLKRRWETIEIDVTLARPDEIDGLEWPPPDRDDAPDDADLPRGKNKHKPDEESPSPDDQTAPSTQPAAD